MLQTMRDDNPQAVDQFMAPILPQWMQAFHSILSHHVQGDAEKATAEYGLKMEVLKVKIVKRTYTRVTRVTHYGLFSVLAISARNSHHSFSNHCHNSLNLFGMICAV